MNQEDRKIDFTAFDIFAVAGVICYWIIYFLNHEKDFVLLGICSFWLSFRAMWFLVKAFKLH